MNKRVKFITLLLCFTLILFVMLTFSCTKHIQKNYALIDYEGGDQYKTFSTPMTQDYVPHFSFEYRSFYNVNSYQSMPRVFLTSVLLTGPYDEEKSGNVKHIDMFVDYWDEYNRDAKHRIERRISEYKHDVNFRNLRILEYNNITLAKGQGYEIISTSVFTPDPDDLYNPPLFEFPIHITDFDLYFDYQNMVWQISLFSDNNSFDQAKKDYEHIVQTLKILD
jgi:hypothetical protein